MNAYFLWLAKFITAIIVVMLIVPLLLVSTLSIIASQAQLASPLPHSGKAVAVVELNGMIMDSKEIVQALHKQVKRKSVKGVVLRINSPGGAVGPSQEIYAAVRKLRAEKPIVASLGSVAASGGLYSALGASKIFVQPGTLTGSIGVIMQMPNLTKISERFDVDMITIKSGKFKDVGNTFREMTAEDRDFLQRTSDEIHKHFVQAVVEGRGIPEAEVQKFADGRVILGSQALKLKLADKSGDVYDAAREIFEILGEPLPPEELPQLFYVEDRFAKLKRFIDSALNLPFRMQRGLRGGFEALYVM